MLVGSVSTHYLQFIHREINEIVDADFSSFEEAGANDQYLFDDRAHRIANLVNRRKVGWTVRSRLTSVLLSHCILSHSSLRSLITLIY